jgi:hypothetical protein
MPIKSKENRTMAKYANFAKAMVGFGAANVSFHKDAGKFLKQSGAFEATDRKEGRKAMIESINKLDWSHLPKQSLSRRAGKGKVDCFDKDGNPRIGEIAATFKAYRSLITTFNNVWDAADIMGMDKALEGAYTKAGIVSDGDLRILAGKTPGKGKEDKPKKGETPIETVRRNAESLISKLKDCKPEDAPEIEVILDRLYGSMSRWVMESKAAA